MSTETIVVFKDSYDELVESKYATDREFAELKGKIIALAGMTTHPTFVAKELLELALKYRKELNI